MNIDIEKTKQFLWLIFKRHFKEKGTRQLIEFRFIHFTGKTFSKFNRLSDIEKSLLNEKWPIKNQNGYNVYFGVNPRGIGGRKTQNDIRDIVCLWLDIDAKNFNGGKEEARQRIDEFPLKPNILVDSGNGYHLYWILEEPIINRSEEESIEFRQIMSGLAIALGGDKQAINFDRVMRLPGTLNIKDPNTPRECRVVQVNQDYFYSPGDFEQFKDYQYIKPLEEEEIDLDYKGKELLINDKNPELAQKDVKRLEVSSKIKRMIITGELQKGNGFDPTRSGRDQAIITGLVAADYNYSTIKSIFFNRFLGCSNRMLEKGEKQLKYEVGKAIKYLSKEVKHISPGVEAILNIKASELKAEEKLRAISKYIVKDLFKGKESAGIGYKNEKRKIYYYFDKSQKLLMNVEGIDFYCYLKDRYELPKRDFEEIMTWIRTHIWKSRKEIEAYNFVYFDNEKNILYISDHNNQIYRLNGNLVSLVNNGCDGVIFEYRSDYLPFHLDIKNLNCCNYFEGGFDWEKFISGDSYVYRYLIAQANFTKEERHNLSADEQRYLLTIYFYSLFFESLQEEKPILCFEGVKSSGKSFIAASIGKILFGDSFLPSHLSDSPRDFKVALSENYYAVFDNLDSNINTFLDAFCAAATGAEISSRKLFTDREEVKTKPHIFIVITSREPNFRRDDMVDRLLLFNTEVVKNPRSRSALFKELRENRERIMAEVLINLNSIIKLLRQKSDWNPPGIFRIADWELFGKKIHSDKTMNYFIGLLEKMNKEKNKFGLEEDPLYVLLKNVVIEQKREIIDRSASELYEDLEATAERIKMRDFARRYRSSMSMARRLANIKEELNSDFDFEIFETRGRVKLYSFKRRNGEHDEHRKGVSI